MIVYSVLVMPQGSWALTHVVAFDLASKVAGPRHLAHMKRSPMLGMSVSLPANASRLMLPFSKRVTKTSYEIGVGIASMKPRLACVIAVCSSGSSMTDIFVLQGQMVMDRYAGF